MFLKSDGWTLGDDASIKLTFVVNIHGRLRTFAPTSTMNETTAFSTLREEFSYRLQGYVTREKNGIFFASVLGRDYQQHTELVGKTVVQLTQAHTHQRLGAVG